MKARKKKADKKPVGRPPYQASDKDRGTVETLVAVGYGQGDIAAYLDIDEKTLRAHFRPQLDFGLMKMLVGAVHQLGRKAVGAPAIYDDKGKVLRAEVVPELGAICFLLKTKGKALGWSERLEVTGEAGTPITHRHEVVEEVRQMLAEEMGKAKPNAKAMH